jgi:mono/diheme cytochrome c family protein
LTGLNGGFPVRGLAWIILCSVLASSALADPRSDYLLHCAGCHQPDGTGLPPSVPSLAGPLGTIASSPAGRDYLARVPGAAQAPLSDEKLAAVLNWVLEEFNRDSLPDAFRPLQGAEVAASRARVLADPLKLRREIWPELGKY